MLYQQKISLIYIYFAFIIFFFHFINDIPWIRNYAMECVAELAWTCKFLYTSSLASFSMLRRLLSIVKVAKGTRLKRTGSAIHRDFEMAIWSAHLTDIVRPAGGRCWQFYYASSLHRKPNRMEWGPVSDWLTAMLRPVSHVDRSPVPIPNKYNINFKQKLNIFTSIIPKRLHKDSIPFLNKYKSMIVIWI